MVRSGTYIEQKGKVGLEVLANTLEKPFVGVNLPVIALFYAKHKVYSATLKKCIFDAKIPCRALKDMQDICWYFLGGNALIHNVAHVLHFEVAITVNVHKSFLEENFLVKEPFITSDLFEAARDIFVAINYYDYEEIVLSEVRFGVNLETVVVVENALHCRLQLLKRFVVHRDAHGNLRVFLSNSATSPDF